MHEPATLEPTSPPATSPTVARALHPAGTRRAGCVADLEAIAAGLADVADQFELDQHEPARSYRRVLASASYDAWIIRWRPSADLELHDHGGSRGVVRVVSGELLEQRGDRASASHLDRRAVRAGRSITIAPTTVHGVANPGPGDALSVHVYSPPLASMNFYEEQRGSLSLVRRERQA